MTVIVAERIGRQAYLLSDCLITRLNSTEEHVDTPLGLYLRRSFPADMYYRSFVDLQQKSVRFFNKFALGIAGTYWLGRRLLLHIAEHVEAIETLEDLIKVVQLRDGLKDCDIAICGFFIEKGFPRIFKYDIASGELLSDVAKAVIGSGEDLGTKYSNSPLGAEDKFNRLASFLYADEIFTAEAPARAIGGAYLGFIYDGVSIKRPEAVTHFFWLARVSDKGELLGHHEPFWLNTAYVDDIAIVRSMFKSDLPSPDDKHIELKSNGPFVFPPILTTHPVDLEDLVKKVGLEAAKNFSATKYHAAVSIDLADSKKNYTFSTFWRADSEHCPFRFTGTWADHWYVASEKIHEALIGHAVRAVKGPANFDPIDFAKTPLEETLEAKDAIEGINATAELLTQRAMSNFSDTSLWPTDFFLFAALRRTVSLKEAFLSLVRAQNYSVAAALLWMQLDTAIRYSAILRVPSAQQFCEAILKEKKKLEAFVSREGIPLTHDYLIGELLGEVPELKQMYDWSFEFVNFSRMHVREGYLSSGDEGNAGFEFMISPTNKYVQLDQWLYLLRSFDTALGLTSTFVLAMADAHPKDRAGRSMDDAKQ